jgi:hypothetical protein
MFCNSILQAGAGDGEHSADLGEYWPDPSSEPFWRRLVEAELALAKPVTRALMSFLGEVDPFVFDKFVATSNFGLRTSLHFLLRHAMLRYVALCTLQNVRTLLREAA